VKDVTSDSSGGHSQQIPIHPERQRLLSLDPPLQDVLVHHRSPIFLSSVYVLVFVRLGKCWAINRAADPKRKRNLPSLNVAPENLALIGKYLNGLTREELGV
jgi:hypothetical protein